MHFYFIYFRHHWKLSKHNVKRKLHRSDWVYPPGTDRSSWVAACPFCGLPSHLPDHSLWQCEHDFVNQSWLKASDSNVLLPQPPLLCISLSCHHCCSSDAGQYLFKEKKIFLSLVASYNFTFSLPWWSQIIIFWQCWLLVTMWPSARCPEMSASLSLLLHILTALQMVLPRPFLCPVSPSVNPMKSNTFTVIPTSPSSGLLRYLCQRDCHVCGGWFQPHVFSHHHSHLLHFHFHNHSAFPLCRREAQGLFYLWVSPDGCHYILWTLFCMHLRPLSETSVEQGKIVAVFYMFVSPMLNPLIYNLQNKDVKRASRKVIQRKLFTK